MRISFVHLTKQFASVWVAQCAMLSTFTLISVCVSPTLVFVNYVLWIQNLALVVEIVCVWVRSSAFTMKVPAVARIWVIASTLIIKITSRVNHRTSYWSTPVINELVNLSKLKNKAWVINHFCCRNIKIRPWCHWHWYEKGCERQEKYFRR